MVQSTIEWNESNQRHCEMEARKAQLSFKIIYRKCLLKESSVGGDTMGKRITLFKGQIAIQTQLAYGKYRGREKSMR